MIVVEVEYPLVGLFGVFIARWLYAAKPMFERAIPPHLIDKSFDACSYKFSGIYRGISRDAAFALSVVTACRC